jgi:glycine oxidase
LQRTNYGAYFKKIKMEKDYILVGQGIAGSLLAAALLAAGKKVLMIDNAHSESSSVVAAGDMNPITGQRFVKTWKAEALRDAMIPMYASIGEMTDDALLFRERNVLRVLHNAKEHNDWHARTAWEAWQGFIGDMKTVDKTAFEAQFKGVFGIAEILQGGKVDMQNVLNIIKAFLDKSDSLKLEKFEYENMSIDNKHINYTLYDKTPISANGIIFCEGWQAIHNPYFNYLPFQVSKGEALVVRLPKIYKFGHFTVKNDITISHLNDDLYWIGATNSFEFVTSKNTEDARIALIKRLENAINLPFEIVEHRAGIRPTVKDRRPLVGQHPQHKNLYIFNGLGTKGASLAPYLVNVFMDFILKNAPLEADIDIVRYADLWYKAKN